MSQLIDGVLSMEQFAQNQFHLKATLLKTLPLKMECIDLTAITVIDETHQEKVSLHGDG